MPSFPFELPKNPKSYVLRRERWKVQLPKEGQEHWDPDLSGA